jgi:PAS domain S-box-containing protein
MQFKGNVLGTIQAINPIKGTFTRQDLNFLVNLANIASSAIANAQQFARTLAAEARYVSLFQDSVDPIILTDMTGQIIEANRRAFTFLGYARDALLNMSIADIHPQKAALLEAKNIQPNEVKVFTSQVLTKEDQLIHVEVYAKRTLFGENEVLQWIHHDISKQLELEEMRQDLTAMLFHDLQSPLGNVISSLELLSYVIPPDGDPSLLSMLDIAMRSSRRLQTLIRSLLDINRLEAGHPISERERVDIYKLIDDVEEIEQPSFEQRKVELVRRLEPDIPPIYVEEDMIRRVLVNLLDNALKYSVENQQITIQAVRDGHINSIIISVSDQGMGIPKKHRKSIFEKFHRIKGPANAKGLGLGLAFCRLAVEAHGGRIWVDDAPQGGARFNFTLPLTPESIPAMAT